MELGRVGTMSIVVAALLAGCGAGDDGSSSGTTTVSDPCAASRTDPECLQALDDGCDERWAAACAASFQCRPNLSSIYDGTVEVCTQGHAEQCKNLVRLPGNRTLPADLHACAQGYLDDPCSDAFREECFVRGAMDIGQPCAAQAECESRRCVGVAGSQCGVCQSARTQGQVCDVADGDCDRSLTCLFVTNTCEPLRVEGETCADHEDCGGLLLCIGGKCSMPLGEGVPCTENFCDPEQLLTCDGGKCVKFAVVGAGQSCAVDWCVYGAGCNDQNVCVSLPIEGQSCGSARCAGPANCVSGFCSLGYANCE